MEGMPKAASGAKIKVLIVDDHPLSRRGISSILAQEAKFELVGEATDGADAVEKARQLMPDLILMDIRMPGMDGLEATQRIKAEFPQIMIVILSVSNNQQDFFEAIRFGAQGYLLKDMQPETWLDYLRALMEGNTPISQEMAEAILREFVPPASSEALSIDEQGLDELSSRELEVLRGVAKGLSNKDIGERLHITENTVKNHLKNILSKLHLRNRAHLVAYAYDRGWLKPDPGR